MKRILLISTLLLMVLAPSCGQRQSKTADTTSSIETVSSGKQRPNSPECKEYSRDEIFKSKTSSPLSWLILSEIWNTMGLDSGDEYLVTDEDVWNEKTCFTVTDEGIVFTYTTPPLVSDLEQGQITILYSQIMPHLHEHTPVWEVAKEYLMNKLSGNVRAYLQKEHIGIGASLEALLQHYPNYSIEIYYSDFGSYKYATMESMRCDYGEKWYGVYNDWAIFTPQNQGQETTNISFFIELNDLESRSDYMKNSKVWNIIQ